MRAIRNNNRDAARFRISRGGSQNLTMDITAGRTVALFASISRYVLLVILCLLVPGLDFCGAPAFGAEFKVTPVFQATIDADGKDLRFPSFLFYDPAFDETYLSAGGGSQVIVYDSGFFPVISFASGRGIDRPLGGFVDKKGQIYVCQGASDEKPGRISVFNGAFILSREIFLDKIPGAPDFEPRQLVVNHDGLLYVAGRQNEGVVVLDNEGVFLRWIRPLDDITYNWEERIAAMEAENAAGKAENAEEGEEPVASSADQPVAADVLKDIPEQFRPKTKEEKAQSGPHIGPVVILSVSIDRSGRLYLLSSETSKTYVYDADETFLFSFGTQGGTPRTLSQPRSVAIDEDRKVMYVVDFMRHAILAYDQDDGTFLFEFGGKGYGPGWFSFPTDIVVNRRGQVIVADLFNQRVQVLDVAFQRPSPELLEGGPSSADGGEKVDQEGGKSDSP